MVSRGLLFVLLVLVLASGPVPIHVGALAQDSVASPEPGATPQSATATPLEWAPCDDVPDTECAWLDVPVDHAQPDGPSITLRLGRVPVLDPAQRQGTLLLIPGGPGAGINEMLAGAWGMRSAHHVDEFRQLYDVVTFDPRGIGQSNPVRCDPALLPPVTEPRDQAPSAEEFAALAETNAAFYESCFDATGELMAHLSVLDTAADIEWIRQALGGEGLIAYAGSYGSAYAGTYLELYPEHVQAIVLDGVIDHSIDMPAFMTRNILGVQDAFDRFAEWCGQEPECALHGEDVGAVFDAVVTIAPVTKTIVPQMLAGGADPVAGWPLIAQILAEVHAGDTTTLEAVTGTVALGSTDEDPWVRAGKNGLFPGVLCATFGPQHDYEELRVAYEAVAQQAPRFAWKFWDATPLAHGTAGIGDCVGWPLEATNPPHPLQVEAPHSNVLIANPTHDPATPLSHALSVWLQIPQSRLLIADVDGHQSLLLSECAYQAQASFLADPSSLASTTLCPN